jgi:hypothetical protein
MAAPPTMKRESVTLAGLVSVLAVGGRLRLRLSAAGDEGR